MRAETLSKGNSEQFHATVAKGRETYITLVAGSVRLDLCVPENELQAVADEFAYVCDRLTGILAGLEG